LPLAVKGLTVHPTAKIYSTVKLADTLKEGIIGEDCFIGDFCLITVPQLVMVKGSQINSGSRLVGRKLIGIGHDSVISYGCTLITTSDSTEAYYMNDAQPEEQRALRSGTIDIGPRVFIGAHSIIMPGVDIGPGVVVRAFSYVNRSLLNKNWIYGGQPACPLYERNKVPV